MHQKNNKDIFTRRLLTNQFQKKERKKWSKWAKEFSNDTDFKKLPDEVEKDVDEIVDTKGNIGVKKYQ